MGPYYVTALVNLLGGVRRVSGSTRVTYPTRTITSDPKKGTVIPVETPTHIVGSMDFENGAIVQIATSFDVYGSHEPVIAIYGSEGTLLVPDPNGFGGEVKVRRGWNAFETVPLTHGFSENARGVGVLDMAHAIRGGSSHRASGDLAYHVLDIMQAFEDSSNANQHVLLESMVDRPEAMGPELYADQA